MDLKQPPDDRATSSFFKIGGIARFSSVLLLLYKGCCRFLALGIFLPAMGFLPQTLNAQENATEKTREIAWVPFQERQDPPSPGELQTIRKMLEAMDAGLVRDMAWWAREYEAVLESRQPRVSNDILRRRMENLLGNLGKCPLYVRDGIGYGCIEAPGSHLQEEFASFLRRGGIDWDSPIEVKGNSFDVGNGDRTKSSRLTVYREELIAQSASETPRRKIVRLKIGIHPRLFVPRVANGHNRTKARPPEMPFYNTEKYPLGDPDAFAFVYGSNANFYSTPCRLASILSSECMPPGGKVAFDYFYYEE